MKTMIYKIFRGSFIWALAVIGLCACEEQNAGPEKPNFPDFVKEVDIIPGTELLIRFVPNMDWTLSVPEETITTFWIDEFGYPTSMLSGKAASEAVVKICTSSDESFSLRSCEVTLAMGGVEEVIAEYHLLCKQKSVEVTGAAVSNGGFVSDENGYKYEPLSEQGIRLVWSEQEKKYYFPVRIQSNIEWTVTWPDWMRADVPSDSKIGYTDLEFYGIASELPMEDTEGYVVFMDGTNEMARIKVTIPGSGDMLTINNGGNSRMAYDHGGYVIGSSGSYSKESVQGTYYAPEQASLVVLSKNAGIYEPVSDLASFWLRPDPEVADEWISAPGSDKLQLRNYSFSVQKYYGKELRECAVVFTPATFVGTTDDLLSSDKTQIASAFVENALYISQSGRPDEYIVMEKDAELLERTGVIFEKKTEAFLPGLDYADNPYMYELSYTKDMSSTNGAMFFTDKFESVDIYNASGQLVAEEALADFWLGFDSYTDNVYGAVSMDEKKMAPGTISIHGYIAFKDANKKVVALLHFIFQKERHSADDVIEDRSYLFADPEAAAQAGFSLVEIVDGPTFKDYQNHLGSPILRLTCDMEVEPIDTTSLTVDLKTSEDVFLYQFKGKHYASDFIVVDGDENFDETMGYLLPWGEIWDDKNKNGQVDNGEMIEGYVGSYDGITSLTFYGTSDSSEREEVVQLFNQNNDIIYYIICQLKVSIRQAQPSNL